MERWRCEMKPLKKSSHVDMMPQVEVKIHQNLVLISLIF